jgi:hypothetical protein
MSSAKLHHVVFCVHPENQERAAAFWRDVDLTPLCGMAVTRLATNLPD